MKIKKTVSTEWLSGCSGCHIALVDLHEKLLKLIENIEFVRIPVLMDEKKYPKADIGLVEGAVRSDHDRQAVLKMRESCDLLVSFGTCSTFGGLSGVGWLHPGNSVLTRTFGSGPTNAADEWPDDNVPTLEQSVFPISEVVTVDAYIPGCPPHPVWIALFLRSLAARSLKDLAAKPVCSRCRRTMTKTTGITLKKGVVTAPDNDICLLSQGVICLGSVTMERCLAQCPNRNVACFGCTGPSLDIITEPHLDIRTMVARRMNLLTGIDYDEIKAYIETETKTFYAYAMASPVMYQKPTVDIREWTETRRGF